MMSTRTDKQTVDIRQRNPKKPVFNISLIFLLNVRLPPTTEGAAGVDAHGPHIGLIGVADTVVEGDEDAGGREQKTQDQQAQN